MYKEMDLESYTWLIKKSTTIQLQMGSLGILEQYQPAYRNHVYTNYPIVLNMIPELEKTIRDSLLQNQAQQYAKTIQEVILRYIGSLEDSIEIQVKEVINPFIWLREGTRFILSFPIRLLTWFGILSERIASLLYSNYLVTIISGLVALIGLVGGIISIVLGWEEFSKQAFQYYKIFVVNK